jgi:ribosome-binding factor A
MSERIKRLNEIMARELSLLLHSRFQERAVLLTITRVLISDDLKHGKVFFASPDEKSTDEAMQFLHKTRSEIKRLLAKRIKIKYFPELHFHRDESLEKELRIHSIFDELNS